MPQMPPPPLDTRLAISVYVELLLTSLYCACALWGTLNQNFDINLRRDHQKVSYECPNYESVDEKSLSFTTKKRRIQTVKGYGLKIRLLICYYASLLV